MQPCSRQSLILVVSGNNPVNHQANPSHSLPLLQIRHSHTSLEADVAVADALPMGAKLVVSVILAARYEFTTCHLTRVDGEP